MCVHKSELKTQFMASIATFLSALGIAHASLNSPPIGDVKAPLMQDSAQKTLVPQPIQNVEI